MKLATFSVNGQEAVGAVIAENKIVVDLVAAERSLARKEKRKPNPYFSDMLTLLEAGSKGRSAAKKATAAAAKVLGKNPKPHADSAYN